MRIVEITRSGDRSVADELTEMQDWLHANDIEADIGPARILKGRVQYRAVFAADSDADRFCRAFDLEHA